MASTRMRSRATHAGEHLRLEEQLLLSVQKMLRYLFPSFALQPARLCIGAMGHSHPENHGASLSDPSERLAPRSQGSVESG